MYVSSYYYIYYIHIHTERHIHTKRASAHTHTFANSTRWPVMPRFTSTIHMFPSWKWCFESCVCVLSAASKACQQRVIYVHNPSDSRLKTVFWKWCFESCVSCERLVLVFGVSVWCVCASIKYTFAYICMYTHTKTLRKLKIGHENGR
jgi:hypothetical protein